MENGINIQHIGWKIIINRTIDSIIQLIIYRDISLLNKEQKIIVKQYHCFIRKKHYTKIKYVPNQKMIDKVIEHLSELQMLQSRDYTYLDQLIENNIPNEERYQTNDLIIKLEIIRKYFENMI